MSGIIIGMVILHLKKLKRNLTKRFGGFAKKAMNGKQKLRIEPKIADARFAQVEKC